MREVSPFHTGRLAPPFSIGPVDFSESNLQYNTPPHLEHCLYASDCWWRHQSWRAVFSLIVRDVLFQSHDASPRAWTHAPSNLRMMCRLSTCPKNRFKKKTVRSHSLTKMAVTYISIRVPLAKLELIFHTFSPRLTTLLLAFWNKFFLELLDCL